jgi:TolA-binding protein
MNMNNRIRNINGKLSGNRFEHDLLSDSDDSALFNTIGEYMKGSLDLEDVKNDPALANTMNTVREMITDYRNNLPENRDNEKFIKSVFSENESDTRLHDEIKYIKQEIDDKNINLITSEWVKEWHARKQKLGASDPKAEEIRNFITDAINSPSEETVKTLHEESKNNPRRNLFVKYTSIAAAALIGAFLLISSLLPSSNPEKLFNSYYKPFDAVSPVTRSVSSSSTDIISSAISDYKTGNYKEAAVGFAGANDKNPASSQSKFLLGLSQLALENYSQSISLLENVANSSGEYTKEAKWYLGLAYLKTGNKIKASECFAFLAKSEGFYKERSEKLLRRLK